MNNPDIVPLLVGFTTVVVAMFGFVMSLMFVQKNKQNNFKRKMLEARVEEQEKTVDEISRNLHDDVAQLLSTIQMKLSQLDRLAIPQTEQLINEASESLREAMMDVRHMSHTLSSDWLRNRGLVGAIQEDLDHINATNQVRCRTVVEGQEYRLKHEKELPIFRIAQEVIHNMFRHANATTFTVKLIFLPDLFTISFADDGKGFSSRTKNSDSGIGIANMHHRAQVLNASLEIFSEPKKGCITTLKLPVSEDMLEPVYED